MRVAVVGPTGNLGTAVLAALQRREEVGSVLGIARRMPDATDPYAAAEWISIGVAAADEPAEAISQLTTAFSGADAVIDLAWLVQPTWERDLLRRVNVDGTRHVARAAAAADVPTPAVASSVGA